MSSWLCTNAKGAALCHKVGWKVKGMGMHAEFHKS